MNSTQLRALALITVLGANASACQISVRIEDVVHGDATGDGAGTCRGAGCPVALSLALNGTSSCARMIDGTTRCWGAINESTIPRQQVLVSSSDDLVLGDNHLCTLTGTTLRCAGSNSAGQLGDGTTADRQLLQDVNGVGPVRQAVAFGNTTCALRTDGTIACWGANGSGQFGDGSTMGRTTPLMVNAVSGVASFAMNRESVCAVLMADGTLRCWGGPFGQFPTTPPVGPLAGVAEIAMGNNHYCARLTDGSIRCWGQNAYGQLGDGTMMNRTVATSVVGITTATRIAVGATHSCALLANRTVQCWGQNDVGQLGDGTMTAHLIPMTVPNLAGIANLYVGLPTGAGSGHTCALIDDGTAWCWGHNMRGQIGDGTNMYRTLPTRVLF